ncbi:hypothetical protein [Pedobacter sp. SYP-B3415]|uniref:hypothetical protein n=1 Tax=Pedobacter sp. SYP-B3415 TaxID=2496641 RepID=UPI00101B7FE9|nr:hypothetical protein [Pedobacter sp. SYP-B3415]
MKFLSSSLKVSGISLLTCALLQFSCSGKPDAGGWKLVYQNDSLGRPVYGSKKDLILAVKRGSPIRVAWGELLDDGTSDVEFATPDFTTLVNESDLVVQFPASMIQTEYMIAAKSYLKTDPPLQWRALMCTDGHYHQFHNDLASGKVTRTMYLKTAMAWYAEVPERDDRHVPALAIPNGIRLDSLRVH